MSNCVKLCPFHWCLLIRRKNGEWHNLQASAGKCRCKACESMSHIWRIPRAQRGLRQPLCSHSLHGRVDQVDDKEFRQHSRRAHAHLYILCTVYGQMEPKHRTQDMHFNHVGDWESMRIKNKLQALKVILLSLGTTYTSWRWSWPWSVDSIWLDQLRVAKEAALLSWCWELHQSPLPTGPRQSAHCQWRYVWQANCPELVGEFVTCILERWMPHTIAWDWEQECGRFHNLSCAQASLGTCFSPGTQVTDTELSH